MHCDWVIVCFGRGFISKCGKKLWTGIFIYEGNLVPRGRDPFVQRRPLPHPLDKSNGCSGNEIDMKAAPFRPIQFSFEGIKGAAVQTAFRHKGL